MPHPPLLELREVSRAFAIRQGFFNQTVGLVRAVDGVSLRVHRGETLGLVGESGCGKSTLARMAARLLPPSSGDMLFDGHSLVHTTPDFAATLPKRLQMIFQDPFSSLNPRLRVGGSIAEPMRAAGVARAQRDERVAQMLHLVGLAPEHAARYPHEFSGGQRQRIAIARALVLHPDLIICDEAVSALDASVQAQVLNLLKDVQKEFSLTYLFISHDLGVVGHMSDRVAVMYMGRIVELAPRIQLFTNPLHPYTKALLASAPTHDPTRRTRRSPLKGELPNPLHPPTGCPFHPRCLEVMAVCRHQAPPCCTLYEGTADERTLRCHHVHIFNGKML